MATNATATIVAGDTEPRSALFPALGNTFGAMLLGTFMGLMIYGLTVHQSYRYIRLYPHDRLILKLPVLLLFVLETVHVVLCMHMCYFYLVAHYFDPSALVAGVWSLRLVPIVTGIVIFVSHWFYVRRIYLMGPEYKYIASIVCVLMAGELAFVIAATVEEFRLVTFARWQSKTWLISAGFGNAVTADIILTTTLIVILRKCKTGFRRTDSMIDVLVVYTINTGLLTGLFSVLSLAFALAQPNNMIYIGLNMVSTRTYANSVLAVLNSRRSLNEQVTITVEAGTFGLELCDKATTFPTFKGPAVASSTCDGTKSPICSSTLIIERPPALITPQTTSSDSFNGKWPPREDVVAEV